MSAMQNHDQAPKIYGWFSEKADMHATNSVYYKTKLGSIVKISSVTNTPDDSKTLWDDIEFLGELSQFVKSEPTSAYRRSRVASKMPYGNGGS
jgi:hypothetical protein